MPTTQSQWAIFVQRLVDFLNLTRDAASKTGVNVIPAAYAVYDSSALPALTIVGATSALDATKTQFGNASLKLTATAATVTVQFTGDPITLAPYLRWIESVYIQSSRTSITGTLAVVTAVKSYSVDISGTLVPASWGRLYGDCDLTADDSTSATILLTLTGCTVGDTFNLEGWQLEAAAGNTNLPSAFVNSAAPGSLTAVPDDASFAKILTSHTSGNVAYNYKGVWSSTTAYVQGDETVYSGSYWLALAANTNSAPAQGNANWQVVGAYNNYQGAWSSTATYYAGQETTYNGNYWVATATNTNSAPSTSNANWVIAGPQNLDQVADGTTYARTQAAVQTGNVPDLSKGILGKTLANIADDATTTRYAVSSIDPARKALIDFTQTGHTGKVLDNIGDGTTYGRPLLSRLNAGNPLIDFAATYHLNKNLDNIGEGASYFRMPAGNMSGAGGRALIDFTQGHINKTLDNVGDGATYVRYLGSDATGNRLDFSKGLLNKHLGNIPDDATSSRYAVANIDGNRRALVDFSQSGHVNKTLDYMPNGSANTSLPALAGSGTNVVANPAFITAALASENTGTPYSRWQAFLNTSNAYTFVTNSNPADPLSVRMTQGFSAAANTTYGGYVQNLALPGSTFTCAPGESFYFGGTAEIYWGASVPSGITLATYIGIAWFDRTGAFLSNSLSNQITSPSGVQTISGTASAPVSAATGVVQLKTEITNTTGAAITLPNAAMYGNFGNVWCRKANNLDTEAVDGTTHGRIAMQDVYQVSGVNRVGVRVAGSGQQLGNLRNNVQRAVTNIPAQVPAAPSYSATAGSPATATISVPAFTVLAGSAPSTPYNASSVSVTGTGGTNVTYYLYFNDPTSAGGTQTLNATTSGATIYQSDGYVYVGSITVAFPTSGSGSGGGSGGGGACVVLGSFGPTGRFDADIAEVLTPDGKAKVRRAIVSPQKCVRVECENGAVLPCSEDAPLMTPRGQVHAAYALGRKIQTSAGRSRVVSVTRIGIREIVAIDAGDVAFYAGESQDGPFILHHNKIIP